MAKYYPKEVFNARIDITQANMRRYDAAQAKIEKAILAKYPNYYKLSFRERWDLRHEIDEIRAQFPWF